MSQTAATLVDMVNRRVRDPSGTAGIPTLGSAALYRKFVIGLISRAQQHVNAAEGLVVGSATLNTTQLNSIYPIFANLPSAQQIVGVRDGNRDLDRAPFSHLAWLDARWFLQTADEFRLWATFGRDTLILWPALSRDSSVTVFYNQLTPTLAGDTDTTVIPDENLAEVLDLTEAMLLLMQRDLMRVAPVMKRLQERLTSKGQAEESTV